MKRYVIIIGLAALAAAAAIATVAFAGGFGPGAKRVSRIAWEPCQGASKAAPKVQCGSIQVPVDWAKPGGPKITVRFARRRADSPDRRIGALFFHPGGPGDGGIGYLTSQSADVNAVFSPTLRARFDIIGVDPRGFGESTPVSCGVPLTVAGVTLFPRTPRQFRRLVQHNRALALSCLRETGPLLGHVDAESVARDHEAVRAALGVREVNFLGISYGTQVAAIYAELYPTRVRTITLDAALEHSVSDSLMLAAEASAVEDSFNRFALWCRTAAACALKSRDVGRLYDDLVKRADRAPIPVAGAVRPVNGEDIRLRTQLFLLFKEPSIYGPFASWAALSQLIKAARAGDASAFATFPTDSHTDSGYSELAVACGEYPSSVHTYAEMQRRIQLGKQLAPHLQGASQTWTAVRCIGWPLEEANPRRPLDVRGTPPILIVNATHDPSTTYAWAHGLAEQIQGSVLLTRVGDGHTSYYTSPCARAAVDRYFLTGKAPAPDAVCLR
jgi:pimeloyl-ACP methyl ester carboxylesterase